MDSRQLASRYNRLVENSWRELPLQVSAFGQAVANQVSLPSVQVEAAILELLQFASINQLQQFCEVMAQIFIPMSTRWPASPLSSESSNPFTRYTDALAHQALAAMEAGDKALVGEMSLNVTPLSEPVPLDLDQCEKLGEAALKLRETILEGFTLYDGQSLSMAAMKHALNLADILSRDHSEPVPQLIAWILEAKGALPTELLDLELIWDAPEEDQALAEWSWSELDADGFVDNRAEELAEDDGGNAIVSRIRKRIAGFSYIARQLVADEAYPSLCNVLAFAPGHARFKLRATAEGPQDYLIPQVSRYAYVPQLADVASLLRCSGSIPVMVDIVSLELAEDLDCPELAGWLRIDWGACF